MPKKYLTTNTAYNAKKGGCFAGQQVCQIIAALAMADASRNDAPPPREALIALVDQAYCDDAATAPLHHQHDLRLTLQSLERTQQTGRDPGLLQIL